MKYNYLLLFILFVVSPNLKAESQKRTLTGMVKNAENGETLPSANVHVKGTNIGTSTNVDGYFTLLNLPEEKFTLNVFYIGCHPAEIEVDLTKISGNLIVELQPTTIDIEEVVISAQNYKMMKATEGVSDLRVAPKDLKSLPSFGEVDIFRSLQLLPGISGTNESSSGLYVRGGTPDQNLVLLDGMTVYNVDHFFGFFSAFNADAIKDIKMFKGGFPAEYGGRISSVVDLTGKTGDPNKFHMSGGINLLNAHASVEVPLMGKGSIILTARRSYTDILESGLYTKIFDMLSQDGSDDEGEQAAPNIGFGGGRGGQGGGIATPQVNEVKPSFYFYDLNGKISFRPSEKDNLALSFYTGKDNLFEDSEIARDITSGSSSNFPSRSTLRTIDQNTNWGNAGTSFKWSRQWSPKFYSNFLTSYSHYFSVYDQGSFFEMRDSDADADTLMSSTKQSDFEDNNVKEITFRLNNDLKLSNNSSLQFGAWVSKTNIDYKFIRDDTLNVLNRDESSLLVAGYIQDKWKVNPKLEINIGGRVNWYDVTNQVYFEPRFSFKYKLTDYLTLKGATGSYHQFVNRVINENVTEGSRDFWLLADNDLVDIQNSWHYIFGSSLENENLLFDVEAYYKTLNGLSEFSLRYQRNNIELNQLFFKGEGVSKGIEFLLQKKQGDFTGWATYTISQVEHQFETINNGNPFPALHDQTHEFKIVGNWEPTKKWRFSSTWVYGSGKPFTEPYSQYSIDLLDGRQFTYVNVGEKNGQRLPAYHRLDVAAHYLFKIGKADMDLGFSIFNLYNRNNIWYREFDLQELPMVVNDITYLGATPNISLNFSF